MSATIETIRESLDRCQAARKFPEVFGAESHRFKLNPVVRRSDVSRFESKHGVKLPEGYRRFITEIGNGGAGPYYGLFKFREMDSGFSYERWRENDGFIGILSQPFPHQKPWNVEIDYPDPDDFDDEELYESEMERIQQDYFNPDNVNGAIPICHQGCAIRNWLIITGPEAGNIWDDHRADEYGLAPTRTGRKKRITFLEWYDFWLQQAVAKLPKTGRTTR